MDQLKIEMCDVNRITPYVRNPRRNDEAVDQMCGSLREFGFKVPLLVRGDGELVDGHLRWKAAKKLGLEVVPVVRCDEWTPAQVKAFRLLVNRSASWAEWDADLVALELADLQELNFDLALTGFDAPEIDAFLGFAGSTGGSGRNSGATCSSSDPARRRMAVRGEPGVLRRQHTGVNCQLPAAIGLAEVDGDGSTVRRQL